MVEEEQALQATKVVETRQSFVVSRQVPVGQSENWLTVFTQFRQLPTHFNEQEPLESRKPG